MIGAASAKRGIGLLWPTITMLVALALLLALGTWQLQRRAWKEGLLEAIAARASAEPMTLEAALRGWRAGEDLEYARVRAAGRFRHEAERFYYAPGKNGPGFHVYTPLETGSGAIVLVNRGFVPERLRDRAQRGEGLPSGEGEVVGLLRASGGRGWFTPDNDPARNLWFWRDLVGMADSALGADARRAVPFFLDEEARTAETWPKSGVTRLDLPNRHLEYALTWYGLGAALIGVYAFFAAGRLRQTRTKR